MLRLKCLKAGACVHESSWSLRDVCAVEPWAQDVLFYLTEASVDRIMVTIDHIVSLLAGALLVSLRDLPSLVSRLLCVLLLQDVTKLVPIIPNTSVGLKVH